MRILTNYELISIGDESLLIPVGDEAQRFQGLLVLNEESAFMVRLLKISQTTESLVFSLLEEYDVDKATAERDVQYLLSRLNEFKVLDPAES